MKFYGAFLAALGVLSVASGANAFDTGHHYDLTREALSELGMNENAIQVAQVENWLVDYFTSQYVAGLTGELEKMHFDNLNTTDKVRNYWGNLTVNTKKAVESAARSKDPLKVVALTGMSLHAVQDFYTHSNWVETHSTFSDAYSTRTWFDVPPPLTATKLVTGNYPSKGSPSTDHGDYSTGMNHDSYGRERWDEAYVYAYSASVQWVSAIEKWVSAVDPGVWASAKKLSLKDSDSAALKKDRTAAYRLSEWIAKPFGADGHWKGKGSGSSGEWGAHFTKWGGSADSTFVKHFTIVKWYRNLTNGLTSSTPPEGDVPSVPSRPLNKWAVRVRTSSVDELPVGFFETRMDMGGSPDFLGQVAIDGQTFVEAMQLDKVSITPAWWSIKFVDAGRSKVSITYNLYDEDSTPEECDINPTVGKKQLDFSLSLSSDTISGDISGAAGKQITSEGVKGDNNRARIVLIVDSRRLRQ